jgi:hypothetical protein
MDLGGRDAVADIQTIHPHLSGVLAPVRTEDDFAIKVVGRIPDTLDDRPGRQHQQGEARADRRPQFGVAAR